MSEEKETIVSFNNNKFWSFFCAYPFEAAKELIEQIQRLSYIIIVKHKESDKYKQALEEIRKEANRLLYEENPIYGYNNSNYFEILAKYVLAKTKEVLND